MELVGKAQGVSDIPLNEIGRKKASDIGDRRTVGYDYYE
jgi:hypothetical protein